MKALIIHEAGDFLRQTGLSTRKLALEAGVNPVTLTRVLSGRRKDMTSSNADKLRDAMSRLSTATPTSPPSSPAEGVAPHEVQPVSDRESQPEDIYARADG